MEKHTKIYSATGVSCLDNFKHKCPKATTKAVSTLQTNDESKVKYAVIFTQSTSILNSIPKSWVLMDSQSTVSVFNNADMLKNVRKVNEKLELATNGGTHTTDMKGELENFGLVWYSSNSLANILSMAEIRKKYRITMDTNVETSITVHRKNGTKMKFMEYRSGLYYYDVPVCSNNYKNQVTDYCFVNTVSQNKVMFTRREVEAADKARELYALVGRPEYKKFERIVANNEIKNCPVNVSDIKRMSMIYGTDVATLKGRIVHQKPSIVPTFEPVVVPDYILQHHGDVHLAAVFLRAAVSVHPNEIEENSVAHRYSRGKQREEDTARPIDEGFQFIPKQRF